MDEVKLNVDGNFINSSIPMGSGGLIRKASGEWLDGFSNHEGIGDALLPEILAMKNGLQFACMGSSRVKQTNGAFRYPSKQCGDH